MSENLNVIVIFPIFGQFEAIFRTILGSQIPDALSVKLIFSLTMTFYLTKIENRTKTSLTQLSKYCFE